MTAPSTDAPAGREPSRLERYGVRGAVALAGLAIAAAVVLTDDRDPVVFAVPALALTVVTVVALTLADRRPGEREMRRAAGETGLDYEGMRPLPAVTPILSGRREPAHVLGGDLRPGGPTVRLARVDRRVVAVTDAPAAVVDPVTRRWLDDHPLRPEAGVEDGLLVVAATGAEASPAALLALARDVHARLARS